MTEESQPSFDVQKLKALAETKVKALWAGEMPLFEVFWIYNFGIVAGAQILGMIFGFVGFIFFLAAFCWAAFMVKPTWLAADKYAGPKHWAVIAKVITVLIALSALSCTFDF